MTYQPHQSEDLTLKPVAPPRMTVCPQCAEHPGMMDTSGFGDFDVCDQCGGSGEVPYGVGGKGSASGGCALRLIPPHDSASTGARAGPAALSRSTTPTDANSTDVSGVSVPGAQTFSPSDADGPKK